MPVTPHLYLNRVIPSSPILNGEGTFVLLPTIRLEGSGAVDSGDLALK
jgi:hypothetical protein